MYSLLSTCVILFFGVHVNALSYPTTKTQGMVGFAKVGGTTGGWSGSVVEINTLADFKKYAGDSTPRVLVINSNIKASTRTTLNLGSNKSIIGSFNKPTLHNIYLEDTSSSGNIIIQNLIFRHDASIKGNDYKQLVLKRGKKYWIDHCSFVGHEWSTTDGSEDKLFEIGEKADYVTLSNCYFGNHRKGLIMGHPYDDNASSDMYNIRMTICNNYFENIDMRSPALFRYGHYHVFNNYVRNYHLGFTIHTQGRVFSENNYFETDKKEHRILNDKGNGQFTDIGSVPAITQKISPKCDWDPKSFYSYKLNTAVQAKSFALASIGIQSSQLSFMN